MAKKNEETGELFPQKRIPAIERAIMKADEKRAEIEGQIEQHKTIVEGLKAELGPLEDDIRKTIHAFEAEVDAQQTESGDKTLTYKRGEFDATVKQHERLSYGKVRERKSEEAES